MLFQIFEKLKSIFTDVKKLETPHSFNHAAYELFKGNLEEFYIRVLASIEKSNKTVYENYEHSSLRVSRRLRSSASPAASTRRSAKS